MGFYMPVEGVQQLCRVERREWQALSRAITPSFHKLS
jgi:hypothetical protein